MKIPFDSDYLRDKYQSKGLGTCGPGIIALLKEISVQEVIDNWHIPYKGYCSLGELQRELERQGFKTKRARAVDKRAFELPNGAKMAIARIQWKGKYAHWAIAQKNTHFVFLIEIKGYINIFCNSVGWMLPGSPIAKRYLKEGRVTSYLVLEEKVYREE